MSSSFNQKILNHAQRHGHVLWKSHNSHPHVKLTTLDGKKTVNMKQSSILTIPKQHATAHLKATGQYKLIHLAKYCYTIAGFNHKST